MTYCGLAITAFFFFHSRSEYYEFAAWPKLKSDYHSEVGGREGEKKNPQDQKEASETMGKVGRREDLLGSVRGQGKSDDGMK